MDRRAPSNDCIPLVVDLNGAFGTVNAMHEAIVQLLVKEPLSSTGAAVLHLKNGYAAFRTAVADRVVPKARALPINELVLETIQQARRDGRKVYLSTDTDERFSNAISRSAGCFDGFFACESGIEPTGEAKAARLVAAFGVHGFDYLGSADKDVPIWREARQCLIQGASRQLTEHLNRELPNLMVLSTREFSAAPYFAVMRPHQWLKNTLVFLPALAAHRFDGPTFATLLIAFLSFCCCASSAYLVNDMLDLDNDRAHPEKRLRPMAAGVLPVSHGAILFACLATVSLMLALTLDPAFILVLFGYFSLSISYSFYLKRKLMIDVVALASLYGARVIAGGFASNVAPSDWLVGFCLFIFLSLALVKRSTELIASSKTLEKLDGRGYRRDDLPTVTPMMVAAGFIAVLVLALYINSPEVRATYQRPFLLWGICGLLTYWLGRLFVITQRGEMRQDPVIFAATDRISLLTGGLIAAIFVAAVF